jgi:TetR/AcrR family transcriptional regulator
MARTRSRERRREILEALARMLEQNQGEHITTAALARAVGVSEAALYRHFPSKARMFDALIEFIEQSLFARVNAIVAEQPQPAARARDILALVLGFAHKNPGIARLLYGDVLVGETERLRARVAQVFERLETELRQVLRESELDGALREPATESAALLVAVACGRITQFVRSRFTLSPLAGWERQWSVLERGMFREREQ